MSKLNMKEWINEIIQKKEVVAMPIMTHPGIEMIGKTVRDAVTDGQVHYNAGNNRCVRKGNPDTILRAGPIVPEH